MIWTTLFVDEPHFPSHSDEIVSSQVILRRNAGQEPCSPVYKLNIDLLYSIFSMNANIEEESDGVTERENQWKFRPLITTRHTSQVCHLWREVILSSSSIWARAFDLRLLDQGSDNWREEVLRRTGKALIHLKGIVRGHHRETREFFERVVLDHWARIRVLDVEIYHPRTFRPEMWNVLARPAPILQSLTLRFRPCTVSPISLPQGPIFSNTAPSLREFFVEQLMFDPQSFWLTQLRKFGIYPTKNTPFTASQLLEIISNMPLLESLTLGNAFPGENPDILNTIPPIQLPRLSEIVIPEMELMVCIAILGKITPRSNCVLDIFCKQRLDPSVGSSSAAADKRAKTVLTRYLTTFFDNHFVSRLSLRRSSGVFTFQDGISGAQIGSCRRKGFRISIAHLNPSFLFDIFSSCHYPEVKTLLFCLDHSDDGTIKPWPSMIAFLQRFHSVQTLHVDRFALHHLNNIPRNVTLFPSLRRIRMIGRILLRQPSGSGPLYNTLANFLRCSVAAGISIHSLDLSSCIHMGEDLSEVGEELFREFGIEISA